MQGQQQQKAKDIIHDEWTSFQSDPNYKSLHAWVDGLQKSNGELKARNQRLEGQLADLQSVEAAIKLRNQELERDLHAAERHINETRTKKIDAERLQDQLNAKDYALLQLTKQLREQEERQAPILAIAKHLEKATALLSEHSADVKAELMASQSKDRQDRQDRQGRKDRQADRQADRQDRQADRQDRRPAITVQNPDLMPTRQVRTDVHFNLDSGSGSEFEPNSDKSKTFGFNGQGNSRSYWAADPDYKK
jgi:chromosome segregation ATPase